MCSWYECVPDMCVCVCECARVCVCAFVHFLCSCVSVCVSICTTMLEWRHCICITTLVHTPKHTHDKWKKYWTPHTWFDWRRFCSTPSEMALNWSACCLAAFSCACRAENQGTQSLAKPDLYNVTLCLYVIWGQICLPALYTATLSVFACSL